MKPLNQPWMSEDADDPPLFRRRTRTIEVRRGRWSSRVRRILFWIPATAGVLFLCGYGGFHLLGYALGSPRFEVNPEEDVSILGNNVVSRDEVLSALGLPFSATPGRRANILRISLEGERKQVESLGWVRSAIVTRVFPNCLVVHIVERTPVGFVSIGGKLKLVDSDGVLLEKPEKANFEFPVILGLDTLASAADRQSRLALYQEFGRELGDEPSSSGWLVSEIDLSDADDLQALLVEGRETILAHFGHSDFKQRFRDFLSLLPEVRRTNTQIDSVDLRYRNQVVVNPRRTAMSGK